MRINTNIASLTAQRSLANTTRAFARALERLSSGRRINRAGDDAAGLAISEGLKSEVRGMSRAALNVNDAFGLLNSADGVMATQVELVQRMRELAVQAANGALSNQDRSFLDTELQSLLAEFERISSETQFNGVELLNGSFITKNLQVGTQKGHSIEFSIGDLSGDRVFTRLEASGEFGSAGNLTTGAVPMSVRMADINGDGHLDLASLDQTDRTLSSWINNGDGTFGIRRTKSVIPTNASSSLIMGDVNNDGRADAVVSSMGGNFINVLLGNEDGSFQTRITTSDASGPIATSLGDFDGDGNMDMVTSGANTNTVSLFRGNGDGTFTFAMSRAAGGSFATSIEVGDFDNDRRLDFITLSPSGDTLSFYAGNADLTFDSAVNTSVATGGAVARSLAVGDFDNDQTLDIVIGRDTNNNIQFYHGTGTGQFTAGQTRLAGGYPTDLDVFDMNADGELDIVTSHNGTSGGSIFYSNGNGTFQTSITFATGGDPKTLALGDLDGDGFADIVTANDDDLQLGFLLQGSEINSALNDVSIETQQEAQDLLEILDDAIDYIISQRGALGALQSRLESALSSILITQENLSAARSQIIDADMAEETAELTRAQILQQAGVSVLGQANTSLQMVLGLLRGL